jgi:putative thioredoxin
VVAGELLLRRSTVSDSKQTAYDVDPRRFEEQVLQASAERPVVADFWAPWCAPCRMLGPLLEEVVKSYGGAVALAKVNVDGAPELASRYDIRGIPAVKIFRGGQVAGEFVGLRPEPEIREMISRLVPSRADELVEEARGLEGARRPVDAEGLYRRALEESPGHPGALLGLARLALAAGDLDAAGQAASQAAEDPAQGAAAEALLARLEFARECARAGGSEAARRDSEAWPADPGALYGLAVCLAAGEDYRDALEALIRVLEADKDYGQGAARKMILRVFEAIGQRSELAEEYRARMAALIY